MEREIFYKLEKKRIEKESTSFGIVFTSVIVAAYFSFAELGTQKPNGTLETIKILLMYILSVGMYLIGLAFVLAIPFIIAKMIYELKLSFVENKRVLMALKIVFVLMIPVMFFIFWIEK